MQDGTAFLSNLLCETLEGGTRSLSVTTGHVGVQFERLCDDPVPVTVLTDIDGSRYLVRHYRADLLGGVSGAVLLACGFGYEQFCPVVNPGTLSGCVYAIAPIRKGGPGSVEAVEEMSRAHLRQVLAARHAWRMLAEGFGELSRVTGENTDGRLPSLDDFANAIGKLFRDANPPKT